MDKESSTEERIKAYRIVTVDKLNEETEIFTHRKKWQEVVFDAAAEKGDFDVCDHIASKSSRSLIMSRYIDSIIKTGNLEAFAHFFERYIGNPNTLDGRLLYQTGCAGQFEMMKYMVKKGTIIHRAGVMRRIEKMYPDRTDIHCFLRVQSRKQKQEIAERKQQLNNNPTR